MTGPPVVGMKNDRIKLLGVYSDRSREEFGANAGLVGGIPGERIDGTLNRYLLGLSLTSSQE